MKDMRPDRDAQRIADLLKGAVPESPEPAGRAQQVVRRARQTTRRRGAVGAVAVAVAVGSVIVTPHFFGTSPVSNDATGQPPGVSLPHPYQCPSPDQTPRKVDPIRGGKVPLGAVLARICDVGGGGTVPWQPPSDPLTHHVDAVARAFNNAPPGKALPCPGSLTGHGISVTFQYPDGHLVRVSGTADVTCDFAHLHGTSGLGRFAATRVKDEFLRQLVQQRSQSTPMLDLARPSCPAKADLPPASLIPAGQHLDLVAASICHYPGLISHQQRFGQLTPAQTHAVDRDYANVATLQAEPPMCRGLSDPEFIVGVTAWGDTIVLQSRGCSGGYTNGGWTWIPGPAVSGLFERLLFG